MNFTEFCSDMSSWEYVSVGSANGLEPGRRQVITWIDYDSVPWCQMTSLTQWIECNSRAVFVGFYLKINVSEMPKKNFRFYMCLASQFIIVYQVFEIYFRSWGNFSIKERLNDDLNFQEIKKFRNF